jgi:hypothetical protein
VRSAESLGLQRKVRYHIPMPEYVIIEGDIREYTTPFAAAERISVLRSSYEGLVELSTSPV